MGATNIMKSFILASFLALSFMAVTEVHGWYGYHYGYWPRYYSHGGKVLGPVKMENVDYGKTKIKFLEKRSVKVIHPANIKMENVDYGNQNQISEKKVSETHFRTYQNGKCLLWKNKNQIPGK